LEIFTFIEAADVSKRAGGKIVSMRKHMKKQKTSSKVNLEINLTGK